MRTFRSHASAIGRERCRFLAKRYGEELRLARMAAGLTQAQVARIARVSQQVVSEAERGLPKTPLEARCRLAAACGHELGWKLYPVSTVSLRDSGQLAIAREIIRAAHPTWRTELERPVGPGELRAADLVLSGPDELLHIEIERSLVDAQAQLRAAQIKRMELARSEHRPVRLVIAMPDTRLSRNRLMPVADVIGPAGSSAVWRAIRTGAPVGRDGHVFVRPDRSERLPLKEASP